MTWTPVNLAPGVRKDDSPLDAQGYYVDADKIRFVNGRPETIYGWELASSTTLLGVCRSAFTWSDNSRNPLAAFGTHLRLYAMDGDGTVTDITPATAYAQQSISFTTAITSAVVTITGWAHNLIADQKFKLENATTPTIGGVTIDGTYTVLTVESATSITYTASQTASSNAGPTASTVDITTYLTPGQTDGLDGIGFGTGGMGTGGYGAGTTTVTLYPRTVSFDQWGQNLLANPRGGGVYEWAPNVTASELVSQGNFSVNTGWSIGSGWTVAAGVATATSGAGSNLAQNISALPGAWHLLTFNLTRSAGTLTPLLDTGTIGAGALSSAALYRLPFYADGGAQTLRFAKDASFVGTVDNVSLKVLTTAQLVPGAPTQIGSMFVTAERSVVACGSNLDGAFDPLQIDWSDFENNQDWDPDSADNAGGFTLPGGGRVVRGLAGARENVVWTLESLWSMKPTGNQSDVYEFTEMGKGCGLIGPNAAALVGGVWYWMTPAGAFFAYGGAEPQMLNCSLARDVKDNIAYSQQDKVQAARIVGKNYSEVWWFYPDLRDGNECSRYVIYDTIKGTWSCGTFDRTAFVDASIFQYPLGVSVAGGVYFHEKGFSANGGPRSYRLESAYNKASGADAIIINGVRPDSDDLQGGYSIVFKSKTRNARGIFERTYPALQITAATGQRSIRVKGEQVSMTVSGTSSPAFWREGATEYDILGVPKSK